MNDSKSKKQPKNPAERKLNSSNSLILRSLALVWLLFQECNYVIIIDKQKRNGVKGLSHIIINKIFDSNFTLIFDSNRTNAGSCKDRSRYCSSKAIKIMVSSLIKEGYVFDSYIKKVSSKKINGEVIPPAIKLKTITKHLNSDSTIMYTTEDIEQKIGMGCYNKLMYLFDRNTELRKIVLSSFAINDEQKLKLQIAQENVCYYADEGSETEEIEPKENG
ncbi:hypothetical protein ENUP19_0254G0032 [Entamoeba nuttalli]|uniref:Uncharacterized protein n=1 Tax=Entamoeba nuttalli TaxID=412467 RepID=A0ABQ0DMA9_9EUKA